MAYQNDREMWFVKHFAYFIWPDTTKIFHKLMENNSPYLKELLDEAPLEGVNQ
jgi:hypothetical protein